MRANIHDPFDLERQLIDRTTFKERRSAALAAWQSALGYRVTSKTELHRVERGSR